MIVVYHLANSRSQRLLWLLEELGLTYEIERYERHPTTRLAPAELKALHPLGKSPLLRDGEVVLAETGLIVEYLCDRYGHGRLAPRLDLGACDPDRRGWLYWLHYAEGSAMPPLFLKLAVSRAPAEVLADLRRDFIEPEVLLHAAYWEQSLTATRWFNGTAFSAADVMMSFPLQAFASSVGTASVEYPHIWAFLQRIRSRPAFARAVARAERPI